MLLNFHSKGLKYFDVDKLQFWKNRMYSTFASFRNKFSAVRGGVYFKILKIKKKKKLCFIFILQLSYTNNFK